MTGSKNAFGTTSRFGQLSFPRKVAVGALALLLGFAIADPAFLTGESFSAKYDVVEDDDVDSLLAKMDSGTSSADDSEYNTAVAKSDDSQAGSSLTIPSYESSLGVIQNASYPRTDNSDSYPAIVQDNAGLSIPSSELPNSGISGDASSRGAMTNSAPVSIRFKGTIYPAN